MIIWQNLNLKQEVMQKVILELEQMLMLMQVLTQEAELRVILDVDNLIRHSYTLECLFLLL